MQKDTIAKLQEIISGELTEKPKFEQCEILSNLFKLASQTTKPIDKYVGLAFVPDRAQDLSTELTALLALNTNELIEDLEYDKTKNNASEIEKIFFHQLYLVLRILYTEILEND